jgi:serine/threonine-protein kinase
MADTTSLQAVLPDYEVTTELGRGAMGIVYLATHRALGRTVAIKELPASFSADATVRERFLTEARTVASLDHPHVVVIHDFVDREGHLALVMEHLPNGTVWDQFLHHGLAAPRACGLVLATLAGVHHAHDRGVMHRDIKPENLIFTHDWQLKVTDFGIAQVLSGDATMGTEEGAIVGTPAYMSPEQAEGRTCGPPADVYASGAMLYEMLTGALPFPDGTSAMEMALARLSDDPVPIDTVGPAVPEPIAEATMHALLRSDSDRFQSAEEFGVALAEAAAFTWGPEWMSESGTAVRGSQAIEQAARTTDRRFLMPGGDRATETGESPNEVTPDADEAGSTVFEGDAATDAGDAIDDAEAKTGTADAPDAAPAPAPAAAPSFEAIPTAAVVPQQKQRVAGADLNKLAPEDIVNLREVRGPGTPLPFLLVGLLLVALGAYFALVGQGADPEPVAAGSITLGGAGVTGAEISEIDLTAPVAYSGPEDLSASFLGIPIGAPTIEGGELDPSYLRFTGTAVVELSSGDDTSFPVRASNSPYPTAPFVAAVLLGAGGLSSVQANLRGLRARRFRISPYLGLMVSGALAGAAAAVIGMIVLSTPADPSTVIISAALAGLGCAVFGEGYRRWYRRRRLKRVAVARSRR